MARSEPVIRWLEANRDTLVKWAAELAFWGEDAEELAAETVAKAITRAGGYDPAKSTVRTWVNTIMVRLGIDRRRRKTNLGNFFVRLTRQAVAVPGEARDPPRVEAILEALEGLPMECRQAVAACYIVGMTEEEAGEMLGMTKGQVRGALWRAKTALRDLLILGPDGVSWRGEGE